MIFGFGMGILAATVFGHCWLLTAQQTERPGCSIDNPIDLPKDLSGLSIKIPRIRVIHTTDASLAGGSMYLQQVDPWLGFAWGKTLFQRSFRERDGVFGEAGKLDGILLTDGATRIMDRGHVSSCGACHNVPYRDAGAGMTISKNGGTGRNTPHLFGAGLVEMIGDHMRKQALRIADVNGDGWISKDEAKGKQCKIAPITNASTIDYGSFDDLDGDGYPDLNAVFFPVFVDEQGRRVATARNLNSPGVAGYTIQVQAFGFGHLYMPFRPPVQTTLRAFTSNPFDIHAGMVACDPTTGINPGDTPYALVSNAGQQQFITEVPRDRGSIRGPTGISHDDPDRDGYCEEITEGDLDVVEWYLLNHPAPARMPRSPAIERGEKLFAKIGCTDCHVSDWNLPSGDRRFFDLQVAWNNSTERLEGKLHLLADRFGDRWLPRRGSVEIKGVYSDFKYHDLGPEFTQLQFDGSEVRMWRTTPLWGVGCTAPYGHDGASLDLDSVIRRHGGEAQSARSKYQRLNKRGQNDIQEFLRSLVLFSTDQLPCDVDGDGKIENHFMVQGLDTGTERFNPEWLFRVPAKIEGPVTNAQTRKITSFALTNIRAAWGLDLPLLKDTDGDGFPDVIDPSPHHAGFRDGVR